MQTPLIASLDDLLDGVCREAARSQPVPRLGFAVNPGLTLVAGASCIGTTSLALKITTELISSSYADQALLIPIADGPTELAQRLSRYRSTLEMPSSLTARVWIDNGSAIRTEEITSRAKRWAARHQTARRLIVVDDLQHLASVEQKAVAGASAAAALRELAIELEARVILCAKLPQRRKRGSWFPARSELLVYGPVLEHSDATIMVYRDGYYHRETDSPAEAILQLWPPQTGRTHVTISWDSRKGTFGIPLPA